jgi:hypothetical protein
MNQILIYSRVKNTQINKSIESLCEKLNQIGYNTEQTHVTHLARLFLNPYQAVHLFIEELPLSMNELFFISFAKTLGKATILSLFNTHEKVSKPRLTLFCPDALTVSQTNHLQFFRDWNCAKSLLPLFPFYKLQNISELSVTENRPYLIPLEKSLDEVFNFKHLPETYFDGRTLLKKYSTTDLRKKWNTFLKLHQIKNEHHLILSDEKINQLFAEQSLKVVLAIPELKHTIFTTWLEKALTKNHLVILNDFQATGFSQSWTSGQNCQVVSSMHWPKHFNQLIEQNKSNPEMISRFKISELSEPLINELSRLYTKILHQKTSLLSSESAKMKS